MKKRDKQIINDLERFRVMSRDDIVDLYFSHLKNPITNANTVLKRMVRDNHIEVSKAFSPYVYFPYNSTMKRNSTKIPHFLRIVDIYKQLKQYMRVSSFEVEPKFQKGLAEPDIFTTIKGTPFFIEIQRNIYSQKVMDNKMLRYESLCYSGEFSAFPFIILITDTRYKISSDVITVFQVPTIHEFMKNIQKKEKPKVRDSQGGGIKFKIG
ncbi:hypothetical protein [Halobacillus sp. A5]|uniref:hypothetical protein n=1 Tax=Halobacillus sp. A5 TaxID=2880263 RepID=UPI0020A643C4|nr:hypothetical protein [Halobacillus sp. A5]MCP3025982.1 hypothetical protein [Halobacillus sp. A5]